MGQTGITMKNKIFGFSLIELMVAVSVVGILAVVAVPAYTSYVYKSRRSEAISTLLSMQLAQEKWRATNNSYTSTVGTGGLGYPTTSAPSGYYNLSIDAASTNSVQFKIIADATGDQASDTDCPQFVVTQDGPDISTTAKRSCWNR